MARVGLSACLVLALIAPPSLGQWPGQQILPQQNVFGQGMPQAQQMWGQQNNGWGLGNMFGQQPARFQTCIGKNTNGDEMRITISIGERDTTRRQNNPWAGLWQNSRITDSMVKLYADYKSPQSTLQGQYQLVVTEFARVEDGCSSQALGEILNQQMWWNPNPTPRGILGNPVTIVRGQNAIASELIENLAFEDFTGRGIAMCPSHQVSGTKCLDIIPLCCKIGHDQQSASRAVRPAGQIFVQGMAMQNQGIGGPINNQQPAQGLPMGQTGNNGIF